MGLSMMIPLRFPPDQRWLEGPVVFLEVGIGGAVRCVYSEISHSHGVLVLVFLSPSIAGAVCTKRFAADDVI